MVEEWDADLWAINTPRGIVQLKTGTLRPHDRAARMTKLTSASLLKPALECSAWLAFLDEVTGGDQDLIVYLQRVAGYCLTGNTSEHALFFLYGTGANGKSVFVNVLTALLGDYAAIAPMDSFMETRSDQHPTDLAGLQGARLVCAMETGQGRRWNGSKIKAITGGDPISARFMRQNFFRYTPQFKLLVAGNHKPSIRGVDEAMKRRLHLIPFTVTIPPDQRDKQLTDKLLKERDAIFTWAVQGCVLWREYGLKPPRSVMAATDEYFDAEDAIGRWLEERCEQLPHIKTPVAVLFEDWRRWADKAGEYPGAIKHFSEKLIAHGFERCRLTDGVRGFKALVLQTKPPFYADVPPGMDFSRE